MHISIGKRLTAFFAALVMVVAVACTATPAQAFAADTGSIVVSSTSAEFKDKTVSAYKMFDMTVNGAGDSTTYGYTLVEAWKQFFVDNADEFNLTDITVTSTLDEVSSAAYGYIEGLGEDDADAVVTFAKKASDWAKSQKLDATGTATAAESGTAGTYTATIEGLPFGYYVVSPQGGSTSVDRKTDAMLVNVNKTGATEINLKSAYPTIDKTVNDNSNHAGAQVGDELTFTLKSTVPDMSEYQNYTFKFKDTLSEGLSFVNDSVVVKIDGTELSADEYAVTEPTSEKGGNLTVAMKDFKAKHQGDAGETITVEYKAKLNSSAVVGEDNWNSATIEYSNNPGTDEVGTSTPDITHQYTFGFDIDKVAEDANGAKLAGAQFELQDANGKKINLLKDTTSGAFRPALEGETPALETDVVTDKDGKLSFTGLGEGTYKLVETKAPDGYNKLAKPIEIEIKAAYNADGTLNTWNITVDGTETPADGTTVPVLQVVNKAGSLLPGTGGIGTVIFTVAGVAVIIGGGLWMAARRRSTRA